jgi:hypothetical protein
MAGYAEPGFCDTAGLAAAGAPAARVGASRRGVAEGVADLETIEESAEEGRCVSCRKVTGRGWELE